jgi:hypothetical protein
MRRAANLLCAALLAGHAAAQTADTLKELLFYHRCPLSSSLQAVYERPAKVVGRARFLTVTVTERPAAFVQCMIADGAVTCEASVFDGGTELSKVPLPVQAVAALQRLGFAIGTGGENLSYEHAFLGKPDFDAIATLMLTALHDAYGVREETELNTYAPFAGYIITVCGY